MVRPIPPVPPATIILTIFVCLCASLLVKCWSLIEKQQNPKDGLIEGKFQFVMAFAFAAVVYTFRFPLYNLPGSDQSFCVTSSRTVSLKPVICQQTDEWYTLRPFCAERMACVLRLQ